MKNQQYRECLASEFAQFRAAAAAAEPAAAVPSCPEWRVNDLVTHVAEVYLHKTESMRQQRFPDPWPPDLSGEEPFALLDRAYAELLAEFDKRPPTELTAHWFEPDPTVGCLMRRMAQETVIHRADAQLAAAGQISPIAADLAVDGVDELLLVMLAYMSEKWPEAFAGLPEQGDAPPVRLVAGDYGWLITPTPSGATITEPTGAGHAATVSADPARLLLWLWGRIDDDGVTIDGDRAEVARLRGLLREATQ